MQRQSPQAAPPMPAAAASTWPQAAAGQWPMGAVVAPWTQAMQTEPPATASDAGIVVLDLASALDTGGSVALEGPPSWWPTAGEDAPAGSSVWWHQGGEGLRAGAAEFVPGGGASCTAAAGIADQTAYAVPCAAAAVESARSSLWAEAPEFFPQAPHIATVAGVDSGGAASAADCSDDTSEETAVGNLRAHQALGGGAKVSNSYASQIVQIVVEYLSSPRSNGFVDKEGYAMISQLVLGPLNRKAFGSTQMCVRSVKAHGTHVLRLDSSCKRVRLLRPDELVRAEAALEAAAVPRGTAVPVSRLLESPTLQAALKKMIEPAAQGSFVQRALEHEESSVALAYGGSHFMRRTHGPHLQRAAEALFSDQHLLEDTRLRTKVAQSPVGELSLNWLITRYEEQLGLGGSSESQTIEETAQELCKALSGSEMLCIDAQRMTVRRRVPVKIDPVIRNDVVSWMVQNDAPLRKRSVRNAGVRLQQLLDFYFEPFNLQHNRLLLDLVAQRAGPPLLSGPWPVEALRDFQFNLEDLVGLGRIASEIARMRIQPGTSVPLDRIIGPLKHLRCRSDGHMSLTSPPEVRSFVPASSASAEVANAAMRYLAVACEQRGQAPAGLVSVLSLQCSSAIAAPSAAGEQRRARLKRQLLLHHTDLVCLQGFDAEQSGASIASALAGEGYSWACASRSTAAARSEGGELREDEHDARTQEQKGGEDEDENEGSEEDACSIFWDRSRWQLLATERKGSALAVVLSPFEDRDTSFRVVCLRAPVPTMEQPDLDGLLGADFGCEEPEGEAPRATPLIVCADLARVGGAEAAAVVEEFAGLSSVMREVVGKELASPVILPDVVATSGGAAPALGRDAASGLVESHHPEAVLFRGLVPAAALSCHTWGFLACMSAEEMLQQFPALRLPIVAAFGWAAGPSLNCPPSSAAPAAKRELPSPAELGGAPLVPWQ